MLSWFIHIFNLGAPRIKKTIDVSFIVKLITISGDTYRGSGGGEFEKRDELKIED